MADSNVRHLLGFLRLEEGIGFLKVFKMEVLFVQTAFWPKRERK